ncbi:MAG TPA: chemotaxis protein CheW [Thermomicrobiales bacterium]|nr:chemotaxis protein CheW [Thermomicrobiales bacterium]
MSQGADIELAAERSQRESAAQGEQYIVVQISGTSYAVALRSVQEVEHVPRHAPVPGSAPWVLGVVNLRGSILTLVDTADLLGSGTWQPAKDARMLVSGGDDPVALAVDRLQGMRRLADISRAPVTANLPGRASEYVTGVHHSDGEWLSVLDIDRLLHDGDRMSLAGGADVPIERAG